MAINSNVNEFLQRIRQGVKPNMFVVNFEFPGTLAKGGTDVDLTNILCKSAALPASNLGVIEVPFRGRTVKIAGDRTFDTWTATFVNDEDMRIRAFMEEWMGEINSHAGNKSALFTPETSGQGYMAHLLVKQLEKDATDNGSVVREYNSGIASQLIFLRLILHMIVTIRSLNLQLNSSYLTGLQMQEEQQKLVHHLSQ